MNLNDIWKDDNLIKTLKNGGVAVMPTDTLYGIVGQADNETVVNRIYTIRKRNPEKPCVILIGNIDELEKFGIALNENQKNVVEQIDEPTSFVMDCLNEKFTYLHRGTKTLAFRIPSSQALQNLLLEIGPLIAPSANTEALPPAENIQEAKNYFDTSVDLYMDAGSNSGKASKIIKLHKDGSITVIRK